MKTKILVALKTKYKTFGFSDKAFDGVADYLSKTVTEDSQVETAIGGVEGLLKAFQGDVDFVRNEKSGLQKQYDELKLKITPETPPATPPALGLTAEDVAKIVADSIKPFAETVSTFQTQTAAEKRSAEVASKAKEFGIPNSWLRDRNIPANTNLDEYFTVVKQDLVNDGFALNQPPETSEQRIAKEGESIAAMIGAGTKEIIDNQKK